MAIAPARELETITSHWQWAFDAAARALDADVPVLTEATIANERRGLAHEREETATLLGRIASLQGVTPRPWLPRFPIAPQLLGLPPQTTACLFDLEGVLTDSDSLHAAAWGQVLDTYLLELAHRTKQQFNPFDPTLEYGVYFDGRSRSDGLRLFLSGRGLAAGASELETLADRKGELIDHGLRRPGIASLRGARRYLLAAGYGRIGRAAVSASSTADAMLAHADLAHLVDASVDAAAMARQQLRPRPSPDLLLSACAELGVEAPTVTALTHSGAGVVAALHAGMHVIGIGGGALAEQLASFGAPTVVPSLAALLDPRLLSTS